MTQRNDDTMAFEKILKLVGEDGKYQSLLFWLFLVPINFLIPWVPLVAIFQASVPDHWCFVPGRPEDVSPDVWKNMTIPWTYKDGEATQSRCFQFTEIKEGQQIFITNFSDPEVGSKCPNSNSDSPNTRTVLAYLSCQNLKSPKPEKSTVLDFNHPLNEILHARQYDCENGWHYDDTLYDSTLPSERDWVCGRDSFPSSWLSAGMVGKCIGTLLFDYLSDLLGRKPMMIATTEIFAIFAIIRLFVTSEWALMLFMLISSSPFPSILQISIIIVLEQVSCSRRARISSASFIAWTFGMSILPLIAWLSRNWVTLGIVTAVPFMPFILMWWLLPESPRWLLSKGRAVDAIKVLEKISIINGKPVSDDLKSSVDEYLRSKEGAVKGSYFTFLDLFKYPTLRKRTIAVTICHISNGVVYHSLLYNISNMSGNEFLNFFYLSITELPADIIGWFAVQYIGRRWSGVGFLFLTTLSVIAPIFIPSSMPDLISICLIASKTWVTASFLAIYIQCSEIFPTSHRSSGYGFAAIATTVVGISGPYIAYSSVAWSKLPYVIISLIGLIGIVAAAFIPETLGCELPQTLSDANEFVKDQPFWSYRGRKFSWKSKFNTKITPNPKGRDNPGLWVDPEAE